MAFAEPHFRLSEERVDDATQVIAVGGELHVSTAPDFSRLLNEAIGDGGGDVVLDLSAVEFIDSTGLMVLANAASRAGESGQSLALLRGAEPVQRLMAITGLEEHLPFID